MSDTAALRLLLRSSRRQDEKGGESLIRGGVVALRLGELRADPDFSEALRMFREAGKRASRSPEPWYGLGLAEEGRSAWEMSVALNLGNRVGLKALERSARHYHRALLKDARYTPAALALARVTMNLRDTALMSRAIPALRRAAAGAQPPSDLILALGRVERAAGKPQLAAATFERYVATGANRGLGLLEVARTRLAIGDALAERAYYQGALLADAKVAAEYRSDIAAFLGDSTFSDLDTLTGASLAEELHRFWTGRDRLEFRSDGERLREHYRRLQYARVHFPLTISRRFYGELDAYRSGSIELDDRGIIYIRHGEPSTRLRPFIFGAMPNESWRYARAEGDLLLHFSAGWDHNGGGDLYDYRLVQSVLDLRGAADAPPDQLLLSRQSLSPDYARMLNWGTYGRANARARERGIGVVSIVVGTTTDTYELEFSKRLAAVADLIAVGQTRGGSLAHLVFGIAASGVTPEIADGQARYRVRAQVVALDNRDRPIGGIDTTLVIRYPRRLRAGEYVVGRAELTLPAGRWRYRASLQQGDSAGVILPRDSVVVTASDASRLQLSDIALGARSRAVVWVTDAADSVLLAPSAIFRKGSNVELYYEASGATPGTSYRHEITVLRSDERGVRGRPLVALSFEAEAAASVVRAHRTVTLDRLKEGSYVVEVKVTGPQGVSQVRRRLLRLIDAD